MTPKILGIDISKKDFHVALLKEGGGTKPKKFTNNTAGFESLHSWLKQQGIAELHACMEATSIYGEALAEFLYEAGYQVSIVNPARIKGFAKSELLRTKTDSVDAALIARFCAAVKPSFWTPTAPEVKELQAGVAPTRFLTRNGYSRTKPLGNSHSNCGWTYSRTFGVPPTTTITYQTIS